MTTQGKGGGEEEEMTWMYQGVSSLVNREDYLTGKKLDKNFQLFGGDKEKDKLSQVRFDVLTRKEPDNSDSAVLDLQTVKNEDPLVSIKVREEKIRREIVDNPIKMKRLQKIVMSAMEKKVRKMVGKSKRRRSKSRTPEERHRSHSSYEKKVKSSSRSRAEVGKSPPSRRKRHDSSFSSHGGDRISNHSERQDEEKGKAAQYSDSDSDTDKRRKQFAGYGLVRAPGKTSDSPPSSCRRRIPSPDVRTKPKSRSPPLRAKRKLTADEMEAKRREMMDNAKWRDGQRSKNLKFYDRREREEEARNSKSASEATDFIRPMLRKAAETGTLESRIKSNIHNLQRSHGSMNSSFARK